MYNWKWIPCALTRNWINSRSAKYPHKQRSPIQVMKRWHSSIFSVLYSTHKYTKFKKISHRVSIQSSLLLRVHSAKHHPDGSGKKSQHLRAAIHANAAGVLECHSTQGTKLTKHGSLRNNTVKFPLAVKRKLLGFHTPGSVFLGSSRNGEIIGEGFDAGLQGLACFRSGIPRVMLAAQPRHMWHRRNTVRSFVQAVGCSFWRVTCNKLPVDGQSSSSVLLLLERNFFSLIPSSQALFSVKR